MVSSELKKCSAKIAAFLPFARRILFGIVCWSLILLLSHVALLIALPEMLPEEVRM